LNGSLHITNGDVLVHGDFEEAADGDILLNGGSFVCDHALGDSRAMYYIYGDFTMSSGIFEITQNHLNFNASATENITGGTIRVGGTFSAPAPNFTPAGGTLELIDFMGGGYPYVQLNSSNYLYNLTISGPDTWLVSGAGADKLTIKNDLTINNGCLNGSDDTLYVADDWINNVGTGGFTCGTGLVILNGTVPTPERQQIQGATSFFDLRNMNVTAVVELGGPITINHNYEAGAGASTCETFVTGSPINISGLLNLYRGAFALSTSAPTVNAATLDQGGSISVTNGTLNVGDIIESGIYGTYTLYNGTVNLTQGVDSYYDLYGDLYIYGGTMNLIGGSDVSYWPGSGSHVLEMSAGVLDFQDVGIQMLNNNITYNITGGKIKSAWHVIANAACSMFDPSGGSVEMYDVLSAQVSLGTGSYFHDLIINKPGFTVTAQRNFPVKGELDLKAGIFTTNGFSVTVGP
jgi:hypothetical protein